MKTSRILLAGLSALAVSLPSILLAAPPSCCVTNGGETLGFAAAEPGPFLEFRPEERVFTRQLDLFGATKVTLRNSHSTKAAKVQVRLVDQKGHAQTFAVELAGGDKAGLDIPVNAVHLIASSREQVELEVSNGGGVFDLEAPMEVARLDIDPDDLECDAGPNYVCDSEWTLTCNLAITPACLNLGPFTSWGRVEVGCHGIKRVYWNLNHPTGNYTTINDQGLTAIWVPGSGSHCPVSVTNSLGHTYIVTRSQ